MVIKKESEIKKVIKSSEIRYTKHFEEDVLSDRINITKKLVKSNLKNPKNLIEFQYEEDTHPREKYELLFDKSNKYYLMIVVSLEEKKYIYVVTSFVMNKEKTKILEKGFGNEKES